MGKKLTLLRTLTSLHVGSGQGAGAIDLEVMRERATTWPVVPGSSVKGVVRDAYCRANNLEDSKRKRINPFGGVGENEQSYAGIYVFSDLRILCFPVRCFHGTFAYVTCPLALERLNELLGLTSGSPVTVPTVGERWVIHQGTSVLQYANNQVWLEDLHKNATGADLSGIAAAVADANLTADRLLKRLIVVDDQTFTYLAKNATEVVTHVTIRHDTKTAMGTGLFVEESVPSEAIFVGILDEQFLPGSENDRSLAWLEEGTVLQFGGKATTGKGICRFRVVSP